MCKFIPKLSTALVCVNYSKNYRYYQLTLYFFSSFISHINCLKN